MGLQGIGISPDCNPENRASPRQVILQLYINDTLYVRINQWVNISPIFQLFNWALEPADDSILDQLFELGYQDAAVWAKENPVSKLVEDGSAFLENGLTQ